MTSSFTATLIIDIGNTILTRSQPGAFHRTLKALTDFYIDTNKASTRCTVAEAILTGANQATAAEYLAEKFSLGIQEQKILHKILCMPHGDVTILPGSLELLSRASDQGWRIIAATNAAAWVPELPSVVASYISATVSSSEVGLLKQDQKFWEYLCQSYDIDPLTCLVIGDDAEADVAAARRSGLLSLQVGPDTLSLLTVVKWLDHTSFRPPEAKALFAGTPESWAGRSILKVPHLAPLVESMTRRPVLLQSADGTQHAVIVRRRHRFPVLVLHDITGCFPAFGWLSLRADHRPVQPPKDLAEALERAELSLSYLPVHDQRHMVSLVREAKNSEVRTARINNIIDHLQRLRETSS
jgi:HAD superfamily hydrolase (TIGR01509 family)